MATVSGRKSGSLPESPLDVQIDTTLHRLKYHSRSGFPVLGNRFNRTLLGWPTIVKIDVEGHEAQVFISLEPCLSSKSCKIIVFENHAAETNAFDTIKRLTEPHGYTIYGIKKSPWSTMIIPTKEQLSGVTDYAVIRQDLITENERLAKLIRY